MKKNYDCEDACDSSEDTCDKCKADIRPSDDWYEDRISDLICENNKLKFLNDLLINVLMTK